MTAALPTLQPLSLGELLDRAIRTYRQNFLGFVGIIALMQIPVTLISLVPSLLQVNALTQLSEGTTNSSYAISSLLASSLSFLVSLLNVVLVGGFARAALTRAATATYFGGHIGILESYRGIGSLVFQLILAAIFTFVIVFGLMLWFLVPCIGWFTGVGMLYFFSAVVDQLVAPVLILEKQTALQAIRRSWDLARRRFWWLVGAMLIIALFGFVVVSGPVLVLNYLVALATNAGDFTGTMSYTTAIVNSLVTLAFTLLYTPFAYIIGLLLYFDLRVRTEGLDIALQTNAATDQPIEAIIAQAPMTQTNPLITSSELGSFVGLSFMGGAIMALIWAVSFGAIMAIFGLGNSRF